jgi:hypothetical protein
MAAVVAEESCVSTKLAAQQASADIHLSLSFGEWSASTFHRKKGMISDWWVDIIIFTRWPHNQNVRYDSIWHVLVRIEVQVCLDVVFGIFLLVK